MEQGSTTLERIILLKSLLKLNLSQSLFIVSTASLPILLFLIEGITYETARRFGIAAVIYFLLAFLLYLFLLSISHMSRSELRRKLVTFTRVYIRFHIAFAIIGIVLIAVHAAMMVFIFPITSKSISGFIAILALLSVIFTGYLRKRKSSGLRRRSHRYTAFLLIIAVIIHVLI
jgi:hypothetical protein